MIRRGNGAAVQDPWRRQNLLEEMRAVLARMLARFAVAQGWGCKADSLTNATMDLIAAFLVGWGPVNDEAHGCRSKFRPGLMEAYGLLAGGLERVAWEWLRTGAPLGISAAIPESGVCPPMPVERRAREEFEGLVARVNVARVQKFSPEDALRQAVDKFERRFRAMEENLHQRGRLLEECDLDELDQAWDQVKGQE